MLRITACILLVLLTISHAFADTKRAGEFDYYVLSLSWSPTWCALQGDAQKSPQCDLGRGFGFMLHGLWPQYATGWPSFCATPQRNPSRKMTQDMADIMGTGGLAWHQWDKHGRCSGLSARDYFALSRRAYEQVARPEIFRNLLKSFNIPAPLVEEAFLGSNPDLTADMLTVTCKRGHFQEVRICLNKDLEPRECGVDVRRDCTKRVVFLPIR